MIICFLKQLITKGATQYGMYFADVLFMYKFCFYYINDVLKMTKNERRNRVLTPHAI